MSIRFQPGGHSAAGMTGDDRNAALAPDEDWQSSSNDSDDGELPSQTEVLNDGSIFAASSRAKTTP